MGRKSRRSAAQGSEGRLRRRRGSPSGTPALLAPSAGPSASGPACFDPRSAGPQQFRQGWAGLLPAELCDPCRPGRPAALGSREPGFLSLVLSQTGQRTAVSAGSAMEQTPDANQEFKWMFSLSGGFHALLRFFFFKFRLLYICIFFFPPQSAGGRGVAALKGLREEGGRSPPVPLLHSS